MSDIVDRIREELDKPHRGPRGFITPEPTWAKHLNEVVARLMLNDIERWLEARS